MSRNMKPVTVSFFSRTTNKKKELLKIQSSDFKEPYGNFYGLFRDAIKTDFQYFSKNEQTLLSEKKLAEYLFQNPF